MSNPIDNQATTTSNAATGGGGGDALDKAVDAAATKAGHKQNANVIEKISDGIRTAFRKITGKNVPVKDQEHK